MDLTGRRGFLLTGAAIYVLASLGYSATRRWPGCSHGECFMP